ncbi:hypothetical protein Tco_0302895 [Tanacetum coccineum]
MIQCELINEDHFRETMQREMVWLGNVEVRIEKALLSLVKRRPIKCNLMQAQESGVVLDEEQSLFLAGEQVTNVDDNVDDSPKNDLALNVEPW